MSGSMEANLVVLRGTELAALMELLEQVRDAWQGGRLTQIAVTVDADCREGLKVKVSGQAIWSRGYGVMPALDAPPEVVPAAAGPLPDLPAAAPDGHPWRFCGSADPHHPLHPVLTVGWCPGTPAGAGPRPGTTAVCPGDAGKAPHVRGLVRSCRLCGITLAGGTSGGILADLIERGKAAATTETVNVVEVVGDRPVEPGLIEGDTAAEDPDGWQR